MANYYLTDLNVVLKSTNENSTEDVEMIVMFNTKDYPSRYLNENFDGDHLKLYYEADTNIKPDSIFENCFTYLKQIDWPNSPFITVTVYVKNTNNVIEADSVTKSEKDVIKPSGGGAD